MNKFIELLTVSNSDGRTKLGMAWGEKAGDASQNNDRRASMYRAALQVTKSKQGTSAFKLNQNKQEKAL